MLAFIKRFLAREPLLVRTAAGLVAAYAVQLLHLDAGYKVTITTAIVVGVATWVRHKVTPYVGP